MTSPGYLGRTGPGRVAVLEASVHARFESGIGEADRTERRLLRQAQASWEQALPHVVYEPSLAARNESHVIVSGASEDAAALIDEAAAAGRSSARAELAEVERLKRWAMAAIPLLALLGLAVLIRLGRTLSVEVLDPVAALRESANRLAAGDLDHRARVGRDDEFGELAASFNAMADAIAGSHRDLHRQAHHDPLTGLANRTAFQARLDVAVSRPQRREGIQAVLFIDLDDFKDVNDTHGHAVGDRLLVEVSGRLAGAVRPGDLVARLGGDEFAVLLDGVADLEAALAVAERAVAAVADPLVLDGIETRVSASAGLAVHEATIDAEELMRQADVAMYLAKGRGKQRVECYDSALAATVADQQTLRADIVGVAARGELVVEYQPIVELATGAVVAAEALLRWQHPSRGLLPPSVFIPGAEDTGAIVDIGAWVLDTAVHQLRDWQDTHHRPDLSVTVNVSPRQLDGPGLVDHVRDVLGRTGVDPVRLVLEITESTLADTHGEAATVLRALRDLGVRIALDDFGTGYSSIGYLQHLPVDILKIDRSFVSGEDASEHGNTLLEGVVALGQHLNLDVIPEGIETADQNARLRSLGCRHGQGFLFSRPMPPRALDQLLAASAEPEPEAPGQANDAHPFRIFVA